MIQPNQPQIYLLTSDSHKFSSIDGECGAGCLPILRRSHTHTTASQVHRHTASQAHSFTGTQPYTFSVSYTKSQLTHTVHGKCLTKYRLWCLHLMNHELMDQSLIIFLHQHNQSKMV